MRFELEEIVCRQGEQCREMYVVLSGKLIGTTEVIHDEPRIRRITSGDSKFLFFNEVIMSCRFYFITFSCFHKVYLTLVLSFQILKSHQCVMRAWSLESLR
jgi:hypothetical protein